MNINLHTYETFPERLKRLIEEAKLTAKEFSEKIDVNQPTVSKYLKGTVKPSLETLILMADCLNVTTDYLLCRRSAVLSLNSPKDNIHIYDKLEFDFNQLTSEYDNFLASILGSGKLEKAAKETVSLISLLLTIHLRDSASLFKNRYDLPGYEYPAFYIRSSEIFKIVNHLFFRLSHDVISRCDAKARFAAAELNLRSSISNLISLFGGRSAVLHSAMSDNLLHTLESAASQSEHSVGRPPN